MLIPSIDLGERPHGANVMLTPSVDLENARVRTSC